MAFSSFHTKHMRHCSLILMLCWPFLLPFNCSSLFPGGTRKLFKDTAAFRTSSFILVVLEMLLILLTSKSFEELFSIFAFEGFYHTYITWRVTSIVNRKLISRDTGKSWYCYPVVFYLMPFGRHLFDSDQVNIKAAGFSCYGMGWHTIAKCWGRAWSLDHNPVAGAMKSNI